MRTVCLCQSLYIGIISEYWSFCLFLSSLSKMRHLFVFLAPVSINLVFAGEHNYI